MSEDNLAHIKGELEKLSASQQQIQQSLALLDTSHLQKLLASNHRLEVGLIGLEKGQEKLLTELISVHSAVGGKQEISSASERSRSHKDDLSVARELGGALEPALVTNSSEIDICKCVAQDEEELPRQHAKILPQAVHFAPLSEALSLPASSTPTRIQSHDSSHKSMLDVNNADHILKAVTSAQQVRNLRRLRGDRGRCVLLDSDRRLMVFNMVCVCVIFLSAWADTLSIAQDWGIENGPLGNIWEWFALVVFSIDMLLSMVTAHKHDSLQQPMVIAHYFRSWFLLDFVATFPWSVFFSDSKHARLFKVAKIVKMIRLLRVLKFVKEGDFFVRVQEWGYSLSAHVFKDLSEQRSVLIIFKIVQATVKFLALVLVEVHVFTCIVLSHSTGGSLAWEYDGIAAKNWDPWFRYFAVMRWSIVVVFAGVTSDSPLSLVVRGIDPQVLEFLMLVCCAANLNFALGIFTFLPGMEDQNVEFQLHSLQLFLRQQPNIPYQTRRSAVSYFRSQTRNKARAAMYDMIHRLPSSIAAHVTIAMHVEAIERVQLFANGPYEDTTFIAQLCTLLAPEFHLAYEPILTKGVVVDGMRFVTSGELIQIDPDISRVDASEESEESTFYIKALPGKAAVLGMQSLFAPDTLAWQRAEYSVTTTSATEIMFIKRNTFDKMIEQVNLWSFFTQFVRSLVSDHRVCLSSLVDDGLDWSLLEEFRLLYAERFEKDADGEVRSEQLGVSLSYLLNRFTNDVRDQIWGSQEPPLPITTKSFLDLAQTFWPGDSEAIGFMGSATNMCPRDGLQGSSIVDALQDEYKAKATHFVSWCWCYTIETVVSALTLWAKDFGVDASGVFLWMCFFCNNQRKLLKGGQAGNLTDAFAGRLTQIGRMIILLDKTTSPFYTTRAWCIFETYTAIAENIPITVALPASSKEGFEERLSSGHFTEIAQSLTSIDAASATATFKEDERQIKTMIRDTIGFTPVNESVKCALTKWLALAFEDCLRRSSLSTVTKHVFRLLQGEHEISHTGLEDSGMLEYNNFSLSAQKYPELIKFLELEGMDLQTAFKCLGRGRIEDLEVYLQNLDKLHLDSFLLWLRDVVDPGLEQTRNDMELELRANVMDLEVEILRKKGALEQLAKADSSETRAAI